MGGYQELRVERSEEQLTVQGYGIYFGADDNVLELSSSSDTTL